MWLSKIKWIGCFKHMLPGLKQDEFHNTLPRPIGYTSAACVRACGGFRYILLSDGGKCACHAVRLASPEYAEVSAEQCGKVCETEEALVPNRRCGSESAFAVFSVESPAEVPEDLAGDHVAETLSGADISPSWPNTTRDQWRGQGTRNSSAHGPKKSIMKGIAYGPVPLRKIGHVPDDDFMAESVKVMWGSEGRGDLAIISALGANAVRLYGNDPAMDHAMFLDEAMRQGLQVIVGISDYPYTQMPGNCITTHFDCYSQVKKQYMQNMKRGFMVAGNVYHPALRTLILMNEPDLKFPGGPEAYVKALVSALDAVLDVEKEVGIAGEAPTLTATFSFGVCGHACPEYGRSPALGQMLMLRNAMQHPESVGYTPRNDVWAAYQTRFINSMNTANPATDIGFLFLDKYNKLFPRTPVFIGEYHSPRTVDQTRDLQQILSVARDESSMLTGVTFFEFQVRYDKGGSEMGFGMFGLESRAITDMQIGWRPFSAHCFKPVEVADIAGHSRRNDCGPIEVGVDFVVDGSWSKQMDHVPEPAFCCKFCKDNPKCLSWTWVEDAFLKSGGSPAQCWLKGGLPTGKVPKDGVISGVPFGTEGRIPTPARRLRHEAQAEGTQVKFAQCGGKYWKGPTACPEKFVCKERTEYFSQCVAEGSTEANNFGLPPHAPKAVPNLFVHQAVAEAFGGEDIASYRFCPAATTVTTTVAPLFTIRADTWGHTLEERTAAMAATDAKPPTVIQPQIAVKPPSILPPLLPVAESVKDHASEDEDEATEDDSSKDETAKDDASKDGVSKDEASKHVASEASEKEASKDDASKEEASKDDVWKEEVLKDAASKDEAAKDEAAKDEASEQTEASQGEASKGGAAATQKRTEELAQTNVLSFYGCYLEMMGSAVASNEQTGYTSSTCAMACGGYSFALVHNGGSCSCSNTKPEMSLLSIVDASLCGEVCEGEEDLEPKRYCGGAQTFAVYEPLQPSRRRS